MEAGCRVVRDGAGYASAGCTPADRPFADRTVPRLAQRREEWHRLYEASARYESLFFDMSWKKEEG